MKQHTYLFNPNSREICLPTAEEVRRYQSNKMFDEVFYNNPEYSDFLEGVIRNLKQNPVTMQEVLEIRNRTMEEAGKSKGHGWSEAFTAEIDALVFKKPVWCLEVDMKSISSSPQEVKGKLALCKRCFQLWPADFQRDLVFTINEKDEGPLCRYCAKE